MNLSLIISSIQKIALYETKDKFFVVGSNSNQTKFRILRIDRTDSSELNILDDKLEYTEKEVHHILQNGIKSKTLPKPISAFGIVGFVKFLEGYYLILVTKRRRVASIGMHVVYKIEDTSLIYVPHESYRLPNHDEPRYLKMFQSIDLSSNFYFSYSYDITHTFQINTATPKVENLMPGTDLENDDIFTSADFSTKYQNFGIRSVPNRKFVWNDYLLSKIEGKIHSEWLLYIMHGFIGQSNVSIFGRSVYVTLIARRSNRYAGTRFLKRGANCNGDVANEVETEQMIIDVSISSNKKMRVSSFVQMRGSIPSQWRQDMTKMVAKPAITFDLSDPYYEIAGAHFNQLFRRYGTPIIILNLVKKREKKKHESQLSEQFNSAVTYLNQFLPAVDRIHYISFDMARMNKGKEAKVMDRLAKIARSVIAKTGFFVGNGPIINQQPLEKVTAESCLQTGVIRVNCVDCLDRTNTAQFALGKCALGFQLYYLGLLNSTSLEFDSDCVRLLEVLYEDHGDTLALQYGGSQLVHRIKTYRKTAPWTSQGNDIMQTLSRYYSNTFSDTEKQHAINLFLGLYVPSEHYQPIWEQNTDYYLHHPEAIGNLNYKKFPLTQWWEPNVMDCLPLPYDYLNKEFFVVIPNLSVSSENMDIYNHYHATDKFCVMGDTYEFKISHSMRDFMPQCVTDFSPFTVRIRPGRMREETTKNGSMKNPSLTGKSSTSSTNSSSSDSYESDDEDDAHSSSIQWALIENNADDEKTEASEMEQNIYGLNDEFEINQSDLRLYDKYEVFGKLSKNVAVEYDINDLLQTNSNQFDFTEPVIEEKSVCIYEEYCRKIYS